MRRDKAIHIAIVGRPNVGKSTLFNRFVGKRKSITDHVSGTTRDRLYERVMLEDKEVYIIDTGGVQFSKDGTLDNLVDKEVNKAILESELVLFVCEVDGLSSLDYQLVDDLRHRGTKVLLVVNKVDSLNAIPNRKEFYAVGLGEPVFVSGLHGNNMDELIDAIVSMLPAECIIPEIEHEFRLAFVGEPNAGKSTLLNNLLKDERVVVSDIPGTTRDFVEESLVYKDLDICLVDTAGIKKKRKLKSTAAIFSLFRTEKIIKNSDVIFLLVDATKGPRHDTRSIYKMILDMGKACILVVNKWDLVEKVTMEAYRKRLMDQHGFFKNTPIMFISAQTGRNVKKLMDKSIEIWENYTASIPTSELNSFLHDIKKTRPPSHKVKFKYIVQVNIKPPAFVLFVKNKREIDKNYTTYLLNRMVDEFKLHGTIPKLLLREETRA